MKELIGAELDYAVAKAEGFNNIVIIDNACYIDRKDSICKMERYKVFNPHENWAIAGAIIDREKIGIRWLGNDWAAWDCSGGDDFFGTSPCIAAMRSYVASKVNDRVNQICA